ncbi:hypothetical protein QBC46DRAFT_6201 [Diplogelasinospora grovesii]|uniref:Uncharacterized protein n=1 Tax=Diplogelasinospora grovesii TaxID=303347 RepID=A0AAN6NFV4_9PEZI|nr:hypothetical protein QBC46DRAFT_6201 [Diplogelasinospora grovesii]
MRIGKRVLFRSTRIWFSASVACFGGIGWFLHSAVWLMIFGAAVCFSGLLCMHIDTSVICNLVHLHQTSNILPQSK